jgi:LacI family transcriptional regulator
MGSQEKRQKHHRKTRKATIKDIARIANVSETTVSLSFQPNSRIGTKTRDKVLKIAKQLNYFPNLAARDLRSGRTKTIGFVINDITNPFYGMMVRTSEQIAMERGYEIIFAESQWSANHEEIIINKMLQSRIEGIILCFSEQDDLAYRLVQTSALPHVVVDTRPEFYNGAYVINDGWHAGHLSAKHLFEIGCRNIAVLNAKKELGMFSSIKFMEEGFERYFREHNHSGKMFDLYDSGLSISSGMESFREMKSSGKEYDGVFCMNDLCAMGVMNEAVRAGLKPGKDFAIIGVDNNEVSDLHMIALSSINIFYNRISEIATDHLIDTIENKTPEKIEQMIRPELIVRESTSLFRS